MGSEMEVLMEISVVFVVFSFCFSDVLGDVELCVGKDEVVPVGSRGRSVAASSSDSSISSRLEGLLKRVLGEYSVEVFFALPLGEWRGSSTSEVASAKKSPVGIVADVPAVGS